jgi:hypothetical protein
LPWAGRGAALRLEIGQFPVDAALFFAEDLLGAIRLGQLRAPLVASRLAESQERG